MEQVSQKIEKKIDYLEKSNQNFMKYLKDKQPFNYSSKNPYILTQDYKQINKTTNQENHQGKSLPKYDKIQFYYYHKNELNIDHKIQYSSTSKSLYPQIEEKNILRLQPTFPQDQAHTRFPLDSMTSNKQFLLNWNKCNAQPILLPVQLKDPNKEYKIDNSTFYQKEFKEKWAKDNSLEVDLFKKIQLGPHKSPFSVEQGIKYESHKQDIHQKFDVSKSNPKGAKNIQGKELIPTFQKQYQSIYKNDYLKRQNSQFQQNFSSIQ